MSKCSYTPTYNVRSIAKYSSAFSSSSTDLGGDFENTILCMNLKMLTIGRYSMLMFLAIHCSGF